MAREERVGMQVEGRILEPPHVPDEGIFVEGPDIRAQDMRAEVGHQGIGEDQGKEGIQDDD
jgi:hypothetical protein